MQKPKMIMFDYEHTLLSEPGYNSLFRDGSRYAIRCKNPKNLTGKQVNEFATYLWEEVCSPIRKVGFDLHNLNMQKLLYESLGIEFSISQDEQEQVFWNNQPEGMCMKAKSTALSRITLITMAALLLLSLLGCGGMYPIESLTADDFFTGERLEIQLTFSQGYNKPDGAFTSFQTSNSMDKLKDRISGSNGFSDKYDIEAVGDSFLLIRKRDITAPQVLYMIMRRDGYYLLFDLAVTISSGANNENRLFFPFHLAEHEDFKVSSYLDLNRSYATSYTADDFIAIYDKLGGYNLQKTAEGFEILSYRSGINVLSYKGFPGPLRFVFEKTEEQMHFWVEKIT